MVTNKLSLKYLAQYMNNIKLGNIMLHFLKFFDLKNIHF